MVKHIILWKLKDNAGDIGKIKENAKRELESLSSVIGEIREIKVNINGLSTSSCDIMLDSSFDSFEDYETYKTHPAHVRTADTFIRPFADIRLCFDYEE